MALQRRRVAGEIPTASTADIAFLLVVFFMLTVTFSVTRGLDLELPRDESEVLEVEAVDSILVEVRAGGTLTVDGDPVVLEGLLGHLAPKLRASPGKPVILHTLPAAPYGLMVATFDELRQGRARLGLPTDIVIAIPTEREVRELWP